MDKMRRKLFIRYRMSVVEEDLYALPKDSIDSKIVNLLNLKHLICVGVKRS